MLKVVTAVLVVAAFAGGGCGGGQSGGGQAEGYVSGDELGDAWPLTVADGVLECEGPGAVTFTSGGETYAVNGTAMGWTSYADIEEIWRDDPAMADAKVSIGPLIERGLALCDDL